jgi:hypothetical protein
MKIRIETKYRSSGGRAWTRYIGIKLNGTDASNVLPCDTSHRLWGAVRSNPTEIETDRTLPEIVEAFKSVAKETKYPLRGRPMGFFADGKFVEVWPSKTN